MKLIWNVKLWKHVEYKTSFEVYKNVAMEK